jgi:hypothetical protein
MKSFSFLLLVELFLLFGFCNREGKKCLEIAFIGTQTRGRKTYDSHQRLTSVRLFIYFIPILVREPFFCFALRRSSDKGGEGEDGKRNVKFLRLGFVSRSVAFAIFLERNSLCDCSCRCCALFLLGEVMGREKCLGKEEDLGKDVDFWEAKSRKEDRVSLRRVQYGDH